jgi:hypothetical protein
MWRRACSRSTARSSARRLTRGRAAAGQAAAQSGPGPAVTILVGFYDEDWPKVWRFGLRGTGRRESGAHACDRPAGAGVPAVRRRPPAEAGGRVLAVDIEDWSGWAYSWFRSGYHGSEEHVRNGRPHGCCRHGLTPLVPRASSSEWLGRSVERTAARKSARNAAVGGKCGKRGCLLDHAGGCFRIRAPPFLGFFARDCGTRRHATCPVVHAVRRRDCRSPRCPEAGARRCWRSCAPRVA